MIYIYIIGYLLLSIITALLYCPINLTSSNKDYLRYSFIGIFWWFTFPLLVISIVVKFMDNIKAD